MAYVPVQTCYVRPAARTVTFASNDNHRTADAHAHAHAVQPEPLRPHAATLPGTQFPAAAAPPQGAGKPRKSKKKKRVRFTPAGSMPADTPPPPQAAAAHYHAAASDGGGGGAGAARVYHHGAAEPSYSPAPPAHGYGYGYGRYAPSPLPRWEMLGTPRRHEYFSREYRWYYPTPVREGIYSIATDANRLTAIFSEENPNACTIV